MVFFFFLNCNLVFYTALMVHFIFVIAKPQVLLPVCQFSSPVISIAIAKERASAVKLTYLQQKLLALSIAATALERSTTPCKG